MCRVRTLHRDGDDGFKLLPGRYVSIYEKKNILRSSKKKRQ